MKLPIFKQSVMTGVDIQPEGIHLVQLRLSNGLYLLEKISFLALPVNLVAEGRVTNWDKLAAILFDWVREIKMVGAVIAAALPVQHVHLTQLAGAERVGETAIQAHLEQAFPGLSAALAMDYEEVRGSDLKKVIIAAAKKDYLEQYTACLRDAGLNVKVMDVDLFAIQRAMQQTAKALLWQQHRRFTLIYQYGNDLPQLLQWQTMPGEQAIADLIQRLGQYGISQLTFCGSSYYVDLFKQAKSLSSININYFSPNFVCRERNLPDYLLAIGLAMREVPAW